MYLRRPEFYFGSGVRNSGEERERDREVRIEGGELKSHNTGTRTR
jgi:hypothetical protein